VNFDQLLASVQTLKKTIWVMFLTFHVKLCFSGVIALSFWVESVSFWSKMTWPVRHFSAFVDRNFMKNFSKSKKCIASREGILLSTKL
jgi:hypothetical protein